MITRLLAFFCLCSFSFGVHASESFNEEINHLLKFVEMSDCIYNRNGSQHAGPEAREHIQKKYDYYVDDIKSAEDFIEYSATKSIMSGNKYEINCPNKAIQYSQDWLLDELKAYRAR